MEVTVLDSFSLNACEANRPTRGAQKDPVSDVGKQVTVLHDKLREGRTN